jgi:hypothetical protein
VGQRKGLCVKVSFSLDLCAKAHELTPFGFSTLFDQEKSINNTTLTSFNSLIVWVLKKPFPYSRKGFVWVENTY